MYILLGLKNIGRNTRALLWQIVQNVAADKQCYLKLEREIVYLEI